MSHFGNLTLVEEVLARLQPAPFWDHLGCELIAAEAGQATVVLRARPEFGRSSNTGDGTAHGGVVAAMIDMAASCALLTVLGSHERRTTVDLAVHYLSPARGDLIATATVRRRGGRTAIIDIEVAANGAATAALGRATFAILKDAPTDRKEQE